MQQLLTFIFIIGALLGMCLPWKKVGDFYEVTGFNAGFNSFISLGLFIILIISFIKILRKEHGYKNHYVFIAGLSILSGMYYFIALLLFPQSHSVPDFLKDILIEANVSFEATPGMGIWVTIVFSIGIIIVNLFMKPIISLPTGPPPIRKDSIETNKL